MRWQLPIHTQTVEKLNQLAAGRSEDALAGIPDAARSLEDIQVKYLM
jgi:hypothetical protein